MEDFSWGHHQFVVRSQTVAGELINLAGARNPASTTLIDQLNGLGVYDRSLASLSTILATELQGPDPDVQRAAAWAFAKAAELYGAGPTAWRIEATDSLFGDPVAALQLFIGELAGEDESFKQAMANVVGDLIDAAPQQQALGLLRTAISRPYPTFVAALATRTVSEDSVPVIIEAAMKENDPRIIVTLLEVLYRLFTHDVVVAATRFAELFGRPERDVRLATCRIFGRLGPTGSTVLPALLDVALWDQDEVVKLAAADAMTSIDCDGEFALYAVKNSDEEPDLRKTFLQLLLRLGPAGEALHRRLDDMWNKALILGPRPGFARFAMGEITSYIFGEFEDQKQKDGIVRKQQERKEATATKKQPSQVNDGGAPEKGAPGPKSAKPEKTPKEKWADSKRHTIEVWMTSGQLKAYSVLAKKYDVRKDQLDTLRAVWYLNG